MANNNILDSAIKEYVIAKHDLELVKTREDLAKKELIDKVLNEDIPGKHEEIDVKDIEDGTIELKTVRGATEHYYISVPELYSYSTSSRNIESDIMDLIADAIQWEKDNDMNLNSRKINLLKEVLELIKRNRSYYKYKKINIKPRE